MRYRRQRLGCGTVFLLAFFVCLIPASFQTGQWWIGLFVAGALVSWDHPSRWPSPHSNSSSACCASDHSGAGAGLLPHPLRLVRRSTTTRR